MNDLLLGWQDLMQMHVEETVSSIVVQPIEAQLHLGCALDCITNRRIPSLQLQPFRQEVGYTIFSFNNTCPYDTI